MKPVVFNAVSLAGMLAIWYVLTPDEKSRFNPLVAAFLVIPGSSLLLPALLL